MLTIMGIYARRHDLAIEGASYRVEKHMNAEPRRIGRLVIEILLPVIADERHRKGLEKSAMACPVKKIRKKARGGHLLSEPEEAIVILDSVKQAVGDVPCTVKLRRGTDDSPEAEANFHQIFSAAIELGYAGSTVHGRTVDQKYLGPSRWSFLTDLVKTYGLQTDAPNRPNFLLGGSGDIFCAQDVADMLSQTGVGWVSVARGCIGNPWIFRQARALLAGDMANAQRPPTIQEQRNVLFDHFRYSLAAHGEHRASLMMRKFGIKFAHHHPRGDEVKKAFIAVKNLIQWEQVLNDWYENDKNQPSGDQNGDFKVRA